MYSSFEIIILIISWSDLRMKAPSTMCGTELEPLGVKTSLVCKGAFFSAELNQIFRITEFLDSL